MSAASIAAVMARAAYRSASDSGNTNGLSEPTLTIAARRTASRIATDSAAPNMAPDCAGDDGFHRCHGEDLASGVRRAPGSELFRVGAAFRDSSSVEDTDMKAMASSPYFNVFSGARNRASPLATALSYPAASVALTGWLNPLGANLCAKLLHRRSASRPV